MMSWHQTTILTGETGSGKTTQVFQCIADHVHLYVHQHLGEKRSVIACTQPNSAAAMSASRRVAAELDVVLGQEVGYATPFQKLVSPKTLVKFLTDDMLLYEAMTNPLLESYSVIVLDEAHKRTLNLDVLFCLIKEICKQRADLKVLIMSANCEGKKLQGYFLGAPLMKLPSRLKPVEIFYTQEPEPDYFETAIRTVIQIHTYESPGDILVFLTNVEEIEDACREITHRVDQLPYCSLFFCENQLLRIQISRKTQDSWNFRQDCSQTLCVRQKREHFSGIPTVTVSSCDASRAVTFKL